MEDFGGNNKNIKKTGFLFFILLFLSLLSCDPYWYNIKIDDNGYETSFRFECGNIYFSSKVISDRQIFLIFRLKLDCPISINPEKFEIILINKAVDSDISLNDNSLKEIKELTKIAR